MRSTGYAPGSLVIANLSQVITSPKHKDFGIVIAVLPPASRMNAPDYLVLWQRRGLKEHADGLLSLYGTQPVR